MFVWQNNNPVSFQKWQMNSTDYLLWPRDFWYQENRTIIQIIKKPIIYPEVNKFVCAAMLLTNLADPEWITVGCNDPITNHVICLFENEKKKRKTKVKKINKAQSKIYNKRCILHYDMCYLFEWRKIYNRKLIKSIIINISALKFFENVFNAVSVIFPPILVGNLKYTMTFKRYGNILHYEKQRVRKNFSGAFIVSTHTSYKMSIGGNLFRCRNNMIISIASLCDGTDDCTDSESEDEISCECSNRKGYSSTCKFIPSKYRKKSCSYFYLTTKYNECHNFPVLRPFTNTQIHGLTDELHIRTLELAFKYPENKTAWKCEDLGHFNWETNNITDIRIGYCSCNNASQIIPLSMVNDLVSDCGSKAEDEYWLKVHTVVKILHCTDKWQIPCREGHPKCYNISDICQYKFNEYKHLTPCRTGEHLQNCRNFKCNMKFKCPGYYCIPWSYTCNGQWDCPHGYDENFCSQNRICPNLFKCKQHTICIHLIDICNSKIDCPQGDDELFCPLHMINCPLPCECLTFAIRCHGIEWYTLKTKVNFPYYVVHLEGMSKVFDLGMLKFIHKTISLSIIRSMLDKICNIIPTVEYMVTINAGFNELKIIETDCFRQALHLKVIKLNVNRISTIKMKGFYNLTALILLDLSNNALSILTENMFIKLFVLETLLIQNNDLELSNLDENALYHKPIKILKTDALILCCLLPPKAMCIVNIPWHTSCTDLLSTYIMKI